MSDKVREALKEIEGFGEKTVYSVSRSDMDGNEAFMMGANTAFGQIADIARGALATLPGAREQSSYKIMWARRDWLNSLHEGEEVAVFDNPAGLNLAEMEECYLVPFDEVRFDEADPPPIVGLTWRSGLRTPPTSLFLDCNYGWEADYRYAQKAVITLSEEDAKDRGGWPVWAEYTRVATPTPEQGDGDGND